MLLLNVVAYGPELLPLMITSDSKVIEWRQQPCWGTGVVTWTEGLPSWFPLPYFGPHQQMQEKGLQCRCPLCPVVVGRRLRTSVSKKDKDAAWRRWGHYWILRVSQVLACSVHPRPSPAARLLEREQHLCLSWVESFLALCTELNCRQERVVLNSTNCNQVTSVVMSCLSLVT